jgi:3-deoxy-D-manno-octulosonic acid kinase
MTTTPAPVRFVASGFRCLVAVDFVPGARALGLDQRDGFDRALEESVRIEGGRSENFLLESTLWPGRVRLRPLQHGGLLARCARDRYFSPSRSEREFSIWRTLEGRGAPIPPAVLAASRRDGFFWKPSFAALNRENAPNAQAWLEAQPRSRTAIAAAAAAVARGVRRFHDAGGIHGDLHAGNVLIEDSNSTHHCWLIDLGRARLRTSPSPRARMRELMRLMRSLEKTNHSECLSSRVRARFLSAYCGADRAMRRAMLECTAREERRLARHRLGWRLRRGPLSSFLATLLTTLVTTLLLGCPEPARESNASQSPIPRLSLLATGDTGRSRSLPALFEGQLAVASALEQEDRGAPVDGLIFLGDNFYWHGLDREHLVERIERNLVSPYCHFLRLDGPRSHEVESACGTPIGERHPVPLYAVLGNHDLELPESAQLQREVVPEFLPDWRMSESLADVVELEEGVSLILFESELAIHDQQTVETALIQAIRNAKGPWRILATHRPIATDDLGGRPIGGYPIWVRDAIAKAGRPVQLALAGHHHNLQAFALLEPSPLLQIGAGSGSRSAPPLAKDLPSSLFGAIELGFARIDLIGTGSSERLSISIFATAPWPIWARLAGHSELASFEVDRSGSVRTLAVGDELTN